MVALINKKPENVRIADSLRDTRVVSRKAYEFALAFGYMRVCKLLFLFKLCLY